MSKRSKKKRDLKLAKKSVNVEQIKEILSVIKIIEVAKTLFKYTSLILFASFIYNWLSTGRFDGGMLFLVLVLSVFYRGFMIVQEDVSLSLYKKFHDEHVIYSDFTGKNSTHYPKYKRVVNYYENLRLDDIVKGGVENVISELNGDQARFKKAVPRNVLQNHRDYSTRIAEENNSLEKEFLVKTIFLVCSSLVIAFFCVLAKYKFMNVDLVSNLLLFLTLVSTVAIYEFIQYKKFSMLKNKNIKASAVITEALGRFEP